MTVPGKRDLFVVTAPKNDSSDKTLFCLSQRYLPLFAYTHTKFKIVEALLNGQACFLKTAT